MNREELVAHARRAYAGLETGELLSPVECFAERFLWHVPGANPASGTYRGVDEYFRDRLERMAPLDEWKLVIRNVLANEAASSALVELELTASRRGRHVAMVSHHMLRFNDAGKIFEAIGFVEDQAELDQFFLA